MNRKSKKYDIAFDNARELLENYLDLFSIFPDYFLSQLEKRNLKVYKLILDKKFCKISESDEIYNEIKAEVEMYVKDIMTMKIKSNIISTWKDLWDNTTFFPYLMGLEALTLREKVNELDYKEMQEIDEQVKNKEVGKQEALAKFDLTEDYFIEYLNEQELDYMR